MNEYEDSISLISEVNRTPNPPSHSIVTIPNRQFRLPINFKTIFQNFFATNIGVKSLKRIRHISECAIQIRTVNPNVITEVSCVVCLTPYRTGM